MQFSTWIFNSQVIVLQKVEYFFRDDYIWKGLESRSKQVVGHIELCDVNLEKKTGRLARVLVPPQFQGKGVATQMVSQVLKIAFDNFGLETIELNVVIFNIPAIACYKKFGFQVVETESDRIQLGGKSWSSYRMELKRTLRNHRKEE